MQAVKAARRWWQATRHVWDWADYHQKENIKARRIRASMATELRNMVRKVTDKPAGLWRLAKWGKQQSIKPPGPPQFPPLKDTQRGAMCTDIQQKAIVLWDLFFPQPLPTDLSDMEGYNYLPPLEGSPDISVEELQHAVFKPAQDKAPGSDGIPHHILQLLFEDLADPLRALFDACLGLGYHPHCFCEVTTVAIRKPTKADYTEPKVWHSIALLNTLGKALETIVAQRICYIAERDKLLPTAQHGCRWQRNTTTALELFTEQVHTVWGQGHIKVVTLLSLDIAGAFDNISHNRVLHNLQRKGVPTALVQWSTSFLANRRTSLVLGRWQSEIHQIATGIPQGSPISPILFLFFNMELVDLAARSTCGISELGFVDDVNILAFGTSTESNCRALECIHHECIAWVVQHGAAFAPQKYELMHLTRSHKRFNMEASMWLPGGDKSPSPTVRVLEVLLDSKLRWGPHISRTCDRATQQCHALTTLSASTWGASFARARLVYSAVVRPCLTYGSTVWAPLEGVLKPAG